MMDRKLRIRPIPVVVALSLAFGAAVTAFGVVKPLPPSALPPSTMIVESLAISVPPTLPISGQIQSERIRAGDTLPALLGRMDVIDPSLVEFVSRDETARDLLDFHAGELVHAELDSLRRIRRLVYSKGIADTENGPLGTRLVIERDTEGVLGAREESVAIERGVAVRTATVSSSLFGATHAAGIPDNVASQIADILGGELDFYRDLRKGDRLEVVYETLAEPDSLEPAQGGRVLALRFYNGAREFSAVWFERPNGPGEYFDLAGHSLSKTFLRYPIEFARISSRFTDARLHPVLGVVRAHKGVDFAAPAGTKIRATGDGVVDFVGQQRGYGNVVIIEHHDNYSTLYAHMSGFANHLRKGDKVAQGDIIGFVGSTGYATGPHLHYEFRVGEEQADPLAIALPEPAPMDGASRVAFEVQARRFENRLSQLDTLRLARFE